MKALIKYLSNKSKEQTGMELAIEGRSVIEVKPFAVTQGFKFGDKVWDEIAQEFCKLSRSMTRIYKGKNTTRFFRVLGEVSPEATFVEDGKEYEVKEIKPQLADYNRKSLGEVIPSSIYEVKCECCGTFK